MRFVRITTIAVLALALAGAGPLRASRVLAQPAAEAASLPSSEHGENSAVHLFAGVEEAWAAADAERLAGLVDTTSVRIAMKPGSPPTSAVTRTAAAFLFQDQLRLVSTKSFLVVKVEVMKKGKAGAEAAWLGDWGGRQGVREVKVVLAAEQVGSRWLLTEVRAND